MKEEALRASTSKRFVRRSVKRAAAPATLESADAQFITAKGEGLKEVVLGAPAFFEIDTKGLDGPVDIRITG